MSDWSSLANCWDLNLDESYVEEVHFLTYFISFEFRPVNLGLPLPLIQVMYFGFLTVRLQLQLQPLPFENGGYLSTPEVFTIFFPYVLRFWEVLGWYNDCHFDLFALSIYCTFISLLRHLCMSMSFRTHTSWALSYHYSSLATWGMFNVTAHFAALSFVFLFACVFSSCMFFFMPLLSLFFQHISIVISAFPICMCFDICSDSGFVGTFLLFVLLLLYVFW